MLQAAGGEAFRAKELLEKTAKNITPLESSLIELVKKAYEQPALLSTEDLDPIRAIAGDDALVYAQVIGGFHFINRIADLLDVSPEALPKPLRRFESIRRFGVKVGSYILSGMDLDNRPYDTPYEDAIKNITPVFEKAFGKPPEDELDHLRQRPHLVEAFQLALEERDGRSGLDREVIKKVQQAVEAALPKNRDEAEGFHTRPENPVEAFAFIGTRYAHRITGDLISALKTDGFDDTGIMDLAIAVADANQWARLHRLSGLKPELFYLNVENLMKP